MANGLTVHEHSHLDTQPPRDLDTWYDCPQAGLALPPQWYLGRMGL